jgi:hypothetical protein
MLYMMLGVVAGASCAFLRYPFIPLLPMGALLATGAVLSGVVLGAHPLLIATEGFASVAAPQVAFVAVGLTRHLVLAMRLIPHVQAAIGQQLRAQLEVPRSLSPELAALVAQLGRA